MKREIPRSRTASECYTDQAAHPNHRPRPKEISSARAAENCTNFRGLSTILKFKFKARPWEPPEITYWTVEGEAPSEPLSKCHVIGNSQGGSGGASPSTPNRRI